MSLVQPAELALRLLLSVVLLASGATKLVDLAGSRKALMDFGLPAVLAGPLGLLLPVVELGIAVSLVPVASAWYGAAAALALLITFIAGIGLNLAQGRTPDCHCFGQVHSEPIGWRTLVR